MMVFSLSYDKAKLQNAQLIMTDSEQGQHGCVSMKAQAEFFLACLHFGASLCTAGPAFSSSFGIPAGSLYSTKKAISKKKYLCTHDSTFSYCTCVWSP